MADIESIILSNPEPDKPKKKKRAKAAKDAEEIGTSRELYNFLFTSLLLAVLLCSCNSVLKKECENCSGDGR